MGGIEMPKEIKMYEANDGKLYKTKKGAENHNKKLIVEKVKKELNMTEEEIQGKLEENSDRYPGIAALLKYSGPWTNWAPHQIKEINADLLDNSVKTTKYVREYRHWGEQKEEILFTEEGPEFTDPELHCEDEYKVVKIEDENSVTKKIYYDYKYTWEERIIKRLKEGDELSESEIREVLWSFDQVYEEEGEDRRWSKSMLTVVNIDGELYAIEWEKGLTENQENSFWEQPYPVELKEEEITITKTTVVKKD